MSQWALQAHADPWLGYTDIDGAGFVVAELSPYESDLDWSELTEPARAAPGGRLAGPGHREGALRVGRGLRAVALVDFQIEDAAAEASTTSDELVAELTTFALAYAERTRDDHRLFVAAFRADGSPA